VRLFHLIVSFFQLCTVNWLSDSLSFEKPGKNANRGQSILPIIQREWRVTNCRRRRRIASVPPKVLRRGWSNHEGVYSTQSSQYRGRLMDSSRFRWPGSWAGYSCPPRILCHYRWICSATKISRAWSGKSDQPNRSAGKLLYLDPVTKLDAPLSIGGGLSRPPVESSLRKGLRLLSKRPNQNHPIPPLQPIPLPQTVQTQQTRRLVARLLVATPLWNYSPSTVSKTSTIQSIRPKSSNVLI
jgi:hypothetical protein